MKSKDCIKFERCITNTFVQPSEIDFSSIRDLINPSMITEEISNGKLHFLCSASFHFLFSYCV